MKNLTLNNKTNKTLQGRLYSSLGFTLLEVLIAMTLLGMIMVMLFNGLRASTRIAEKGEQRVDEVNRLRVTHEFIRTQLRRIVPLTIKQEVGEAPIRFEGESQRMRFIAPMPGHLSRGGPYVQTLELTEDNVSEGSALLFHHQLLQTLKTNGDTDNPAEPVSLLNGINHASFSYLGWDEEGEIGEWQAQWEEISDIPLLIKIDIEMSSDTANKNARQLRWPQLVVSPMVQQPHKK